MKNILIAALLTLTTQAFAHTIVGTPVLKGSLKTKVVVNNVETTCRVKVEKIKNLMQEDSYGNPAYNVRININLNGNNKERTVSVKFDRDYWVNNLFSLSNGRTEVRDFEYASAEGARMAIDKAGRLKNVVFPFNDRMITCSFR